MKKLFLISGIALAMVACTNDEDVVSPNNSSKGQKEIAFSVAQDELSRATVNADPNNKTFSTDNTMYMSALYMPEGSDTGIEYFINKTYKYRTGTGWKYHNGTDWDALYYPLGGSLRFMGFATAVDIDPANDIEIAYRNASGTEVAKDSGEVDDFLSMSVDFRDKLNGSEDVMYKKDMWDSKASSSSGSSAINFNHALSFVQFKVKVSESKFEGLIKVRSITLNDAAISGKLIIHNDTKSDYTGNQHIMHSSTCWVSWDLDNATKATKPLLGQPADGLDVTTTVQNFGYLLLLSGQKLPSFTVVYDYIDGDGNVYNGLTATQPINTSVTLGSCMLNVVTLDMTPTMISYSVSSTEIFKDTSYPDPVVNMK